MNTDNSSDNELIAAPATPMGISALAVIRTAGKGCIDKIAKLTSNPDRVQSAAGNSLVHTQLVTEQGATRTAGDNDRDEGRSDERKRSGAVLRAGMEEHRPRDLVDDVVLGVFRSPHSYTGDDAVEIYCHGSPAGVERILELLYRNGFRRAEPGEFTMRAFLAGKMDLTRAEAVNELITAQTATAHEMALARLSGSIEQRLNELKERLVGVMAHVAVHLDYPEDEIEQVEFPLNEVVEVRAALETLAATYQTGKLYAEGIKIALGGRTNAGKSSLFNLLLREDRSIVSEHHGTTRDYITSNIEIGGVPVELFDTAGLRVSTEEIEEEGIRRTQQLLENTDLVIYLVDGTHGLAAEDRTFLAKWGVPDRPQDAPDRSQGADEWVKGAPDRPQGAAEWVKGAPDRPQDVPDRPQDAPDRSQGADGAGSWHRQSQGAPKPPARIIPVWNKADLPGVADRTPEGFVALSATTARGLDKLHREVLRLAVPERRMGPGAPVIDSLRQKQLLDQAIAALRELDQSVQNQVPIDVLAVDLQEALSYLGEITGEVTSQDVLDAVFSQFCVGK